MSLRFLLDENISQTIVGEVRRHKPIIDIESVHTWRESMLEGLQDYDLLLAAGKEGWTLVTYDLKTIPGELRELYARGEHHAGVVFVDNLTIANDNFGELTRALIYFWERHQELDWRDRLHFLDRQSLH